MHHQCLSGQTEREEKCYAGGGTGDDSDFGD